MRCPECKCKFRQKYALWTEDDLVICPKCKKEVKPPKKEDNSDAKN